MYSLHARISESDLIANFVGVFTARAAIIETQPNEPTLIGVCIRWGIAYEVFCQTIAKTILMQHGLNGSQEVFVGTILGSIDRHQEKLSNKQHSLILRAPCDGILHLEHASGVPFISHGQIIEKGTLLAQIEAMKLYYEIRGEWSYPCILKQWNFDHASPIRFNDELAVFEKIS